MTQNEFFNILMDGLKDFPESKLHDIISYYEHNFTAGLADGKTEEEIINEFGNPNLIVSKFKNEDLQIPKDSNDKHDDSDTTSTKNQNLIQDIILDIDNKSKDVPDDNKINTNSNNNSNSSNIPINANNNINNSTANESNKNFNDDFYNLHNENPLPNNQKEKDNHNSSNSNKSSFNSNNTNSSQFNVNNILRICIVILTLVIFSPVITGIIGFIFGLFGIALSIFLGSIGVLIGGTFTSLVGLPNMPAFVTNFPYPAIVLFSLGSITLSIFLTILFYYLCKLFVRISIKFYNLLKAKGGTF